MAAALIGAGMADRIEQSEPDVSIFSKYACLAAAVATPVDADFRPHAAAAAAWVKRLLADGCDGITILGTTGEGPEFSLADRCTLAENLVASDIDPDRL
ncbi:MAG: dihydrodipicolinate synthase family protein, partial [Alphaproteobacteria bacterium]